jgi:two-component system nitrogen regulation response regulator NtrX
MALEAILSDEGYEVATAESGEDGLQALRDGTFDALLLDIWLPGIDGLETLRELRERNIETEVVMISGHGTIETAVRATKLGAFDFVEKPLSLEKTLLVLRNALRQRRLMQRNRRLLEQLARDTEIVGKSAATATLRKLVDVAAESDAPVLICGERGSGREMVARRIHAASLRPSAPFVEMPCSALDDRAAERALYGGDERRGRIALASGGTLFLEDVERLPAKLQRRLAATLLERSQRDPGLRVLACVSSPDDLDPELQQFMAVLRIDVPSLRERREDIPLLAERFMREIAAEYGREPKRLSPDSLAALRSHSWPGNVRELGNLMEGLLLSAAGETVSVPDLPEELGGAGRLTEDLYREFGSLEEGRNAFERYYITRVRMEAGGDDRAAAKRLGLSAAELKKRIGELSG